MSAPAPAPTRHDDRHDFDRPDPHHRPRPHRIHRARARCVDRRGGGRPVRALLSGRPGPAGPAARTGAAAVRVRAGRGGVRGRARRSGSRGRGRGPGAAPVDQDAVAEQAGAGLHRQLDAAEGPLQHRGEGTGRGGRDDRSAGGRDNESGGARRLLPAPPVRRRRAVRRAAVQRGRSGAVRSPVPRPSAHPRTRRAAPHHADAHAPRSVQDTAAVHRPTAPHSPHPATPPPSPGGPTTAPRRGWFRRN